MTVLSVGEDYSITLTRGDTATLEFKFTGDAPTSEDTVVAAVKMIKSCDTASIDKVLEYHSVEDVWVLHFDSADTEALKPGSYWWDIRIQYHDGQVTTPIAPSPFLIMEVVTNLPQEESDGG